MATARRFRPRCIETGLAWMTLPLAGYEAAGDIRKPYGSGVAEIVPYQAFQTSDGWLMIAAGNDNLFRKFCDVLGRKDLVDRSRLHHQLRNA